MRPRRRRADLDRQVPRKRDERINEEIRAQRVRLVDDEGEQVGILATKEALEFAYGKGLDLVEVAAGADPPVARVMCSCAPCSTRSAIPNVMPYTRYRSQSSSVAGAASLSRGKSVR